MVPYIDKSDSFRHSHIICMSYRGDIVYVKFINLHQFLPPFRAEPVLILTLYNDIQYLHLMIL